MTQNATKQLSDLKPGDQVFVRDCRRKGNDRIETIERITKTQIILSHNNRFRIKDGHEIGGDLWWKKSIRPATPDLTAEVKREDEIKAASINALSLVERFKSKYRLSDNVAAAIPHLEAALAALKGHPAP